MNSLNSIYKKTNVDSLLKIANKKFIQFLPNFILAFILIICFSSIGYTARESLDNRYGITVYDNGGFPDLTVEPIRLQSQLHVIDRFFDENDPIDQCIYEEGAIKSFGWRRLMVFDVVIVNAGDGDLIIGDRSDLNNPYASIFYFDKCHGHYHMKGFSEYLVRDVNQNIVATGHKQGFCFMDSIKYTDHPGSGYTCKFQGITSGWGDWYYKQLAGQWVDVTDLPPDDNYTLEVNINIQDEPFRFQENVNRYPNTIQVPTSIPKRAEK